LKPPENQRLSTLTLWFVRFFDGGLSLPILVSHHDVHYFMVLQPGWLRHGDITVIAGFVHGPAVLGELYDLPVWTLSHVELELRLGHVMTGVVGTDVDISLGMVLATFDQMGLDPLPRDLVRRVVGAGQRLLPRQQRHDERLM